MAKTQIREDPKFKMLVKRLRLPRAHVLGMLQLMWMTCYDDYDAHDPSIFESGAHAEAAADWDGEDGIFSKACVDLRWLDKLPDGKMLRVHNFWKHCPNYVRQRLRERQKNGQDVCESFKEWQSLCKNSPLNPRPKTQDPRPIKKRGTKIGVGSDQYPAPIAYVLKDGSDWELPSARVEHNYVKEFEGKLGGAAAVIEELNKARRWLEANESKRKTARGMPRFLTSWCERAVKDYKALPDPDAVRKEQDRLQAEADAERERVNSEETMALTDEEKAASESYLREREERKQAHEARKSGE